MVNKLFLYVFRGLNTRSKVEMEAVRKQYPFEPLEVLPQPRGLGFRIWVSG